MLAQSSSSWQAHWTKRCLSGQRTQRCRPHTSGEEQEAVYPAKDLELLVAGIKQLLATGALDKALFARPEDAEVLPVDPDTANKYV